MLDYTQAQGELNVTEEQPKKKETNLNTILFMVVLSLICALILSVLASALEEPKEIAMDLDRSKQMMIAAKVLSHDGYFIMENEKGEEGFAKATPEGNLEPAEEAIIPSRDELLKVYDKRFKPVVVNDKGDVKTFEEAHIKFDDYISDFKKTGYFKQKEKLLYKILPNKEDDGKGQVAGYVIPVNGFGLWDAIYGYLALKPDADTIIGISWYDQKETPGLGANISEAPWQSLFPGKVIFQESQDGSTNFKLAPIGITVVKGKVSDVLGDSPKAKSAVDGMAGATLTGNGVTDAYRDVLSAYRPFLVKAHDEFAKNNKEK